MANAGERFPFLLSDFIRTIIRTPMPSPGLHRVWISFRSIPHCNGKAEAELNPVRNIESVPLSTSIDAPPARVNSGSHSRFGGKAEGGRFFSAIEKFANGLWIASVPFQRPGQLSV